MRRAEPLNAETPLHRLRDRFLTPTEYFYLRCHGNRPTLDPDRHTVEVAGRVATPLSLTVADLKACFETRTVVAVMQCAGNRRAGLQAVRPTSGDPWTAAPSGTPRGPELP